MAKALRTIAVVAGAVALVATGIGAIGGATFAATALGGTIASVATWAGVVAGVAGIGATLLTKPPPARGSVTETIIEIEPPSPYLMGEGYFAGVMRHRVGYGPTLNKVPNPFLWEVLALTVAGPIEGPIVPQVDFGPVTSYYSGWLATDTRLGARPDTSLVPLLNGPAPGWGGASHLSSIAAIGWNHRFDKDGKVYASGLPTRGALAKWVKVYDPRLDSTRPGGAGPCRLGIESTYVWSESPALHAGTYAFGRYVNGKRVMGVGLPEEGIDWEGVAAWANDCDANGWRLFGAVFEGAPGDAERRWQNLRDIAIAGGGQPLFSGAVLGFHWHRPRVALDTVTEADLAEGPQEVTAMKSWRDRLNTVRPRYTSPAHNWSLVQADQVQVASYLAEDGEERAEDVPFNFVKDVNQAAQLAAYWLTNSRELSPITLTLMPRMRNYRPGECLHLQLPELGLDHDAVILRREFDPASMTVTLTLVTEDPAKHGFALGRTGVAPPTPSLTNSAADRDDITRAARAPYWPEVDGPGRPEDDATVGATMPLPGEYDLGTGAIGNIRQPDGTLYLPGDILNEGLELTPGGLLQRRPLPNLSPIGLGQLALPDLGAASETAIRSAEKDVDALAEALATALSEASRTRETFTDAGFYSDPATGQVRIHAIEQTRERVSSAEIRLNAAEANINLRATVNYVDEAILNAVLDPSQIADLESVFLRLTTAEVDIDGLQASVNTLATATELSLVSGRVTTAQSEIDALEGVVSAKVDTTTFNSLATRVANAENTLTAIGDTASIVNAVRSVRLISRDQDANAEADLRALLQGDRQQRDVVAAIAAARQELRTDITNGDTAEAAARLALQSRVGQAEASIANESLARVNATSALAASISVLSTNVAGQSATLATFGESINGLRARQGVRLDVNGRITGFVQNNDGTQGDFDIVADNFRVIDPDTGVPFIDADETGLRIRNGRFIADNGVFMEVIGQPFGTSNQFLAWSGPSRALNLCDEASATFYRKTNGDSYFGGSLSAGVIRNAARTTDIGAGASITIGPFGTNGNPILVVTSYSALSQDVATYPATAQGLAEWNAAVSAWGATPGTTVSASKAISCNVAVRVDRTVGNGSPASWATLTITGGTETLTGQAPTPGDQEGSLTYLRTVSGSITSTDNAGGTQNRTFTATITTRTNAVLGTIISQIVALTATEE